MQYPYTFRSSLLRCARIFSDEVNIRLEPLQLNYSLWQVLFVLHLKQRCKSIDLAEYLNVSKPSIAKRVKILMQMEIFEQIETEDKRQKMLQLTQHGLEVYQQCTEMINQLEQQILAPIQSLDIEQAQSTIELVIQQLQHIKTGEK